MTWRTVDGAAAGTTHLEANIGCQDRARTRVVGPVAVAVLADGAGSAAQAERGAELVCDALLAAVERDLGGEVAALDDDTVRGWFAHARAVIAAEAAAAGNAPRDYAATGLLVVAGSDATICAQVGDGGIVVREPGGPFSVALWPNNGEYANETFFVIDEHVDAEAAVVRFGPVDAAIVFSDGIARLALDHAARAAHPPFFEPLVRAVQTAPEAAGLRAELAAFLANGALRERTDDDVSLGILTRIA